MEYSVDRKELVSALSTIDACSGLILSQYVRFDFLDYLVVSAIGHTNISISNIPINGEDNAYFSFYLIGQDIFDVLSKSKADTARFEFHVETRMSEDGVNEEEVVRAVTLHLGKSKSRFAVYTELRNYSFVFEDVVLDDPVVVSAERFIKSINYALGFVRPNQFVELSSSPDGTSIASISETSLFIDQFGLAQPEMTAVIEAKSLSKIKAFLRDPEDICTISLSDNYVHFYHGRDRLQVHRAHDMVIPNYDPIVERMNQNATNLVSFVADHSKITSGFGGASIFNKRCKLIVNGDGTISIESEPSEFGDYSSTFEVETESDPESVSLNSPQMKNAVDNFDGRVLINVSIIQNASDDRSVVAQIKSDEYDYPTYYVTGYSE